MKIAVLAFALCCAFAPAAAQDAGAPAPPPPSDQTAPPAQETEAGFIIEHVPPRLSADAQRVESRCVRATTSHAAVDRASRQTKGTRGTHGECAGQGFRGDGGADILSGVQGPATIR